MIGRDLRVGWLNGVVFTSENLILRFDPDSSGGNSKNFISHAHGDHTGHFDSDAETFSTVETRDIFVLGRGGKVRNYTPICYENGLEMDDVEVIPHNSGHMLGSALFEIRSPESTIVYTGDLNFTDTLTTQRADPVECDTLIIESTYGNPRYVFPSREDTYANIIKWAINELKEESIPTFCVYPAGKAQEIVSLFNKFTKIAIVTHPSVTRVMDVCVDRGLSLDYLTADCREGEELLTNKACVFVVPAFWTEKSEGYSRARVTGWASQRKGGSVGGAFPLSSHADFEQLIRFVELSKARRVYTVFGYTQILSEVVAKRLNKFSEPLRRISQTELGNFL